MSVKAGGGWAAVRYGLRAAGRTGGALGMWRALRTRNACKTCALGMGGQLGGMVNERGHFPEVCKKSIQAMAADMRGALPGDFTEKVSLEALCALSSRELEAAGRLTRPLFAGRGDTHYRAVSWEEALSRVSATLRGISPNEALFYSSGRSSNEAAFLLQLFARAYLTDPLVGFLHGNP